MTTEKLLGGLLDEIDRQITAFPIPPPENGRKKDVIFLSELGEEYRLQLRQLRDKIFGKSPRQGKLF
jgi:hypothetical protein